jgi:chromate transporter
MDNMRHLEIFLTALRLGLTSFGGPVAHLSFFHDEYVKKKKWLSEEAYADLVALCQFLPGPASSQVGMAIGLSRGGIFGAVLSWIGFTLPSALILIFFGLGITHLDLKDHQHWLHGLKVVAVAVVAQAILGMGKKLCPDKERITIALISSFIVLNFNSAYIQILVLICAGLVGFLYLKSTTDLPHDPIHQGRKSVGAIFIAVFLGLFVILPLLRAVFPNQTLHLFDSFYRAGALVFGGGHVVLALLKAEVVPSGWVTNDLFMAGYGVANAIPGPLFAFSSYLGAVSAVPPNGVMGGIISLMATFLPSFLLIIGVIPFWEKLRSLSKIRQSMMGLNAGVVGILLAAFYNPVWTSAIFSLKDLALACVCFILLEYWRRPSWAVVLFAIVVSFFIY